MIRSTLATLALLLATAALTACGESSKPLTLAQLRAKTNAICKRAIEEVDWRKATFDELARKGPRLAAIEEQASAEVSKLEPPGPAMALEWRILADNFRATGQAFRRLNAETEKGGEARFLLEPVLSAMRERVRDASSAGIPACRIY
jgi:hypothetical protein